MGTKHYSKGDIDMKMNSSLIALIVMAICTLSGCSPDPTSLPGVTPDEIAPTTATVVETTEATSVPAETDPTNEPVDIEGTTAPESTEAATGAESENKTTQPANNTSSDNNTGSNNKPVSNNSSNNTTQNKTVAVKSVSLSKTSLNVTVGSSSSFTVTINPSNATNTNFTVSTSNSNASVSCSGSKVTVTGKTAGSCTITVTSNNGKTAKCSVTIKNKQVAQVTDDTPLNHDELFTEKNVQKMCDAINSHFKSKGMIYTPSLNTSNSGWLFGYQTVLDKTAVRSLNQVKQRAISGLDEEVEAVLIIMFGGTYDTIRFNCYYEKQPDGEYNIYFAYQ